MSRANFAASVALVLQSEGGFENNPADTGGVTNHGITIKTLSAWRGKSVSIADVKALTADEAALIYRAKFWNAAFADDLPTGIDYAVFDFAVNSGPATAIRKLQSVLGVAVDGIMGPATLAAAAKAEPVGVINALTNVRMIYLQSLDGWNVFGAGWLRRVVSVNAAAIKMLAQSPAQRVPYPPLPKPQPIPSPVPAAKKPALPPGAASSGVAGVLAVLFGVWTVVQGAPWPAVAVVLVMAISTAVFALFFMGRK